MLHEAEAPSTDHPDAPQPDAAAAAAAARRGADNLSGAAWMIVSGLAATGMSVAVKMLSGSLETPMIAFLRCVLGLLLFAPMLADGGLTQFRWTRPWLHVTRGVMMGFALNFGFFALAELDLTTATILLFLAPVFVTALAGPILAERVGAPRWAAVAAGFLGALIILRPGAAPLEWGMLSAIASAVCFSVALILSRMIGREDGPRMVMLTSTVVASIICLPIALPVWEIPTTPMVWLWIGALVLASSLRMYSDIRAYAVGEAAFVSPFSYLRLLFVGVAGWALFHQTPDQYTLMGGAVIISASLFIAYRERLAGRPRSA